MALSKILKKEGLWYQKYIMVQRIGKVFYFKSLECMFVTKLV